MTGPTKALLKLTRATICLVALVAPAVAWSYTAVAYSETAPNIAFIGKGATSAAAAQDALRVCQYDLKRGGYVPVCRVTLAYEQPGWFAIVCGEAGCGAGLGHRTLREAQEGAYEECYKRQKFCYTKMTAYGEDVFPGPALSTKGKK